MKYKFVNLATGEKRDISTFAPTSDSLDELSSEEPWGPCFRFKPEESLCISKIDGRPLSEYAPQSESGELLCEGRVYDIEYSDGKVAKGKLLLSCGDLIHN